MSRLAGAQGAEKVLRQTSNVRADGNFETPGATFQAKAPSRSKKRPRRGAVRFFVNNKTKIGVPCFLLGFATCAWLNIFKPKVVVKKVRKKAPKLTISELSDDEDDEDTSAALIPHAFVPKVDEEMKMVLVVDASLEMGAGKVAAQCAHAALGAYQAIEHVPSQRASLKRRESEGQKKICLRVDGADALAALAGKAKEKGLAHYVVRDAGRTQVAAGSRTVLAIGPAPEMAINEITGGIRLL